MSDGNNKSQNMNVKVLPGGTMEVTPQSDVQAEKQNTGRLTRAMQSGTGYHVETATGRVTETGTEEYQVGHETAHEGSVLSTLRDTRGLSVNDHSAIDLDNCVVRIGSLETSVRNALNMGYLSRDSQGNLRDTNRRDAEVEAGENQPQEQPIHLDPIMSTDGKNLVFLLKQNVGDEYLADTLIMKALNACFLDKPREHTVDELASHAHLQDSTDLRSDMEVLANDIVEHLGKEVVKAGGDPKALKWVMENADAHIKAGLLRRAYLGEGSCIHEIIDRYRWKNRR